MTIREFCEWAIRNGAFDYKMVHFETDDLVAECELEIREDDNEIVI